jgi:hypothetical protein
MPCNQCGSPTNGALCRDCELDQVHADDYDAGEYELESDGGLDQAATFDEDDEQEDEPYPNGEKPHEGWLEAMPDVADRYEITPNEAEVFLEDAGFDPIAYEERTGDDDPENDDVHEVEEGVWVDPILFDNRVDELGEAGLSEREAQVVAAKEQGHTHEKVAIFLSDFLEQPVPKSTVDEYSRRARSKVIQARKLIEEAGDVYEQ